MKVNTNILITGAGIVGLPLPALAPQTPRFYIRIGLRSDVCIFHIHDRMPRS
jgi:hypothetical protein